MRKQALFSIAEAKQIGDALRIDWRTIAFDQLHTGQEEEKVRTARDSRTATSQEYALITGRIAMAISRSIQNITTRYRRWKKSPALTGRMAETQDWAQE